MDDLGFNKIAAAVLATGLGFMLIKEVPHLLVHHAESSEIPAYALEMPDLDTGGEEAIEVPFPSPAFIAAMDSTKGAKVFKKCVSCHNADADGANGTGPNLYNIVGQAAGQKAGFKYSAANSGSGITWNYEELDGFLTKPGKYLSGTAMNFVGLKKEEDRAAVIEYLRLQSGNPVAPPVAAVQEATAPEEIVIPGESVIEEPQEDGIPQETPDDTGTPSEDTPVESPATDEQ